MKREFVETKISIIKFTSTDLLTASGEDDAIVKDGVWSTNVHSNA